MGFNITNKEYDQKVKKASPNSKIVLDVILAFAIGGFICVIGQIALNLLTMFNFSKETSASVVCVIMIFLGSLLTALNIYGDIAKYGGAGTLVPITGFANSVVSSAMEFKSEGIVLGLGSKMFTIAGPVLVFGVISSVVCGLFYYSYLLIF